MRFSRPTAHTQRAVGGLCAVAAHGRANDFCVPSRRVFTATVPCKLYALSRRRSAAHVIRPRAGERSDATAQSDRPDYIRGHGVNVNKQSAICAKGTRHSAARSFRSARSPHPRRPRPARPPSLLSPLALSSVCRAECPVQMLHAAGCISA